MGVFDSAVSFENQEYSTLLKFSRSQHSRFTDPRFPTSNDALFHCHVPAIDLTHVQWRRAAEFQHDKGAFTSPGSQTRSFHSSAFANPHLAGVFAALWENKSAFERVVPPNKNEEWQSAVEGPFHPGIFCFHLWYFGKWRAVVVDDHLPFYQDELLFTSSSIKYEFWPALLEKSLAKLLGSYEFVFELSVTEISTLLSGGLVELVSTSSIALTACDLAPSISGDDNLLVQMPMFQQLSKALQGGSLLLLKTEDTVDTETHGLQPNSCYAISCLKLLNISQQKTLWLFDANHSRVPMVRVTNPRNGGDWTGDFSNGSKQMEALNRTERDKIGLQFTHEHQFWMHWRDVIGCFETIFIVHNMNTGLISMRKTWTETIVYDRWHERLSGGSLAWKDNFLNNPQFFFDIPPSPEGDEVFIELAKRQNKVLKEPCLSGITLLRVEMNRTYRIHSLSACSVLVESEYSAGASRLLKFPLSHGRYAIIPATQNPGHEADFMLRLFSTKAAHLRPVLLDEPPLPACDWLLVYPQVATRVILYCASSLTLPTGKGKLELLNAYCEIQCEGDKVQSSVVLQSNEPQWNQSFLFFRKRPDKNKIVISVFHQCRLLDEFVGQVELDPPTGSEGEVRQEELLDRRVSPQDTFVHRGKLTFEYYSVKREDFVRL